MIGDLLTWRCTGCAVDNVADRPHCANCHALRAGKTAGVERVTAMDLEEFCRRQAAKGVRTMAARLDVAAAETYLTLDPQNADRPQVFLIANENGVAPCDNYGRVSW